jgi:hypothetical protein
VLKQVFDGKWDIDNGPLQMQNARRAVLDELSAYQTGVEAGDQAWTAISAVHPEVAQSLRGQRYVVMLNAGHFDAGFALGRELFEQAKRTEDLELLTTVISPALHPKVRLAKLDEATLRAAAEEVFRLRDPKSADTHLTMAQVHFVLGEQELGEAAAAKTLELAQAPVRENYRRILGGFKASLQKK